METLLIKYSNVISIHRHSILHNYILYRLSLVICGIDEYLGLYKINCKTSDKESIVVRVIKEVSIFELCNILKTQILQKFEFQVSHCLIYYKWHVFIVATSCVSMPVAKVKVFEINIGSC